MFVEPFFPDDFLYGRYFYTIRLNDTNIKKYKYLTFIHNDYQKPTNMTNLPPANFISTNSFNYSKGATNCVNFGIARIENMHLSITIIYPFIYPILFITMLIFSFISILKIPKRCIKDISKIPKILVSGVTIQPFFSRGISPYIALLFNFIFYLLYLNRFYLSIETLGFVDCMFTGAFGIPVLLSLIFLFPINSIRWVFILNLNKRKEYFYKKKIRNPVTGIEKSVSKMKLYVKIINGLTKWYSTLIFIFIGYLIPFLLFFIGFLVSKY
jgi:hypothetical protein